MKYKLKEYDIWEFGQRKDADGNPHQEDSIYPLYGKGTDADRLFILCDGMGGHAAGEVASATVCEAMSISVMTQQPDPEGEFTDDMLLNAISDAYDALDLKDSGDDAKKMGTTLTFLKLHAGGATIAHMGDSRVYHIRPGKDAGSTRILHKTSDHSLVNDLVRAGELTEEEARHSRQKNVITRAMQPHLKMRHKAEIYHTVDIQPGDYFYLCSDGMLEQMTDENLCFNFSELTGSNENKVKILEQATKFNADNHSAIIVQITDVIDPLPVPKKMPPKAADTAPLMASVVCGDDENRAPVASKRKAPQPTGPNDNGPEPEGPSKSGNKTGLMLAIIVLLLAIIGGVVWYLFLRKPTPEKTPRIENVKDIIEDYSTDDKSIETTNEEPTPPREVKRSAIKQSKPNIDKKRSTPGGQSTQGGNNNGNQAQDRVRDIPMSDESEKP